MPLGRSLRLRPRSGRAPLQWPRASIPGQEKRSRPRPYTATRGFDDRQRAVKERPRSGEIALVLQQACEVFEARRGPGMLGPERLLADRQRAVKERPRSGEIALVLQQACEVFEARRGPGMLGPERLLADRQGALIERPRSGEVALGLQQECEVVEARRGRGMLGPERLLADRQGALIERPRSGEIALVLQQACEVFEARRGPGMLGPERLLADRQGALTAARPICAAGGPEAWVTAAGRSPIRIASSRSSSVLRPVKLAMRGGTPTNGLGGGFSACDWPSTAAMMRRLRSSGSSTPNTS